MLKGIKLDFEKLISKDFNITEEIKEKKKIKKFLNTSYQDKLILYFISKLKSNQINKEKLIDLIKSDSTNQLKKYFINYGEVELCNRINSLYKQFKEYFSIPGLIFNLCDDNILVKTYRSDFILMTDKKSKIWNGNKKYNDLVINPQEVEIEDDDDDDIDGDYDDDDIDHMD